MANGLHFHILEMILLGWLVCNEHWILLRFWYVKLVLANTNFIIT